MSPDLQELQTAIGYQFKDESLLATALTHRSSLNEPGIKESNERLEFLGDAVLELIITNFLFHTRPADPEGFLTAARSAIVRTESLSQLAQTIKLGQFLKMSRGEAASGGRENPSLLEDAFEALTGAIYQDGGFAAATAFLERHLFPYAQLVLDKNQLKDPKSLLQEKVQAKGLPSPVYQVNSETGPDHQKTFQVEVMINGKSAGLGSGKSKQEAEQEAASAALETLSRLGGVV